MNGSDLPTTDNSTTANPKGWKMTAGILYTITISLALVGNILVIYILYKRPETRRLTRFMYVNLAVADLLVAVVVMPQTLQAILMDDEWLGGKFGEFLAKFVIFTFFVALTASVFSLTAIAFDSFFSIAYPMNEFSRFRNKLILVPCIWLSAMCLMSPWLVIVTVSEDGSTSRIDYKFSQFGETQKSLRGVYLFIVITIYVLPLATISFLYGYICQKLRAHTLPGVSLKHDKARLRVNKTKRQVIRMSISIAVAFALCWLPTHVFHVMIAIDYEWVSSFQAFPYVMLVCLWCGHANSVINPWLLIYFKKRFRAVFQRMITRPLSRVSFASSRRANNGTISRPPQRSTGPPTDVYQCISLCKWTLRHSSLASAGSENSELHLNKNTTCIFPSKPTSLPKDCHCSTSGGQ